MKNQQIYLNESCAADWIIYQQDKSIAVTLIPITSVTFIV